jgi:hypothetical protein
MQIDIGLTPLASLRVTASWVALDNSERRAFLEKWLARLTEFQIVPNGVLWTYGKSDAEGDAILMLWNLIDESAVNALIAAAKDPEVTQYFEVAIFGGPPATDQEMIWKPFLRN